MSISYTFDFGRGPDVCNQDGFTVISNEFARYNTNIRFEGLAFCGEKIDDHFSLMKFEGCIFEGVTFHCRSDYKTTIQFKDCLFNYCKFSKEHFCDGSKNNIQFYFEDCNLNYSTFQCPGSRLEFITSSLRGASFLNGIFAFSNSVVFNASIFLDDTEDNCDSNNDALFFNETCVLINFGGSQEIHNNIISHFNICDPYYPYIKTFMPESDASTYRSAIEIPMHNSLDRAYLDFIMKHKFISQYPSDYECSCIYEEYRDSQTK